MTKTQDDSTQSPWNKHQRVKGRELCSNIARLRGSKQAVVWSWEVESWRSRVVGREVKNCRKREWDSKNAEVMAKPWGGLTQTPIWCCVHLWFVCEVICMCQELLKMQSVTEWDPILSLVHSIDYVTLDWVIVWFLVWHGFWIPCFQCLYLTPGFT